MNKLDLAAVKLRIVRVCRMHFYIALALAVQIVAYDAWKLLQPRAVLERWVVVAVLFISTTLVWLLARSASRNTRYYSRLIASMVVVDVLVASALVYQTRGMASKAVLLYVLPILVAGIARSRIALIGAAFLSVAAYTTTAVAYFVINFNEGYKIELYGEIGFYSAFLVLLSLVVWALLNPTKNEQ